MRADRVHGVQTISGAAHEHSPSVDLDTAHLPVHQLPFGEYPDIAILGQRPAPIDAPPANLPDQWQKKQA
jgi:hypothetical protein